jgi:hypothetical protein
MIREFNGNTPRIAESAFVREAAYVVGSSGKIKGQPTKQQLWWDKRDLKNTLSWPGIIKNKAYNPTVKGTH